MVDESTRTSPAEVLGLLAVMCELLGAQAARFYVADYSLRRLQQLDERGPVGPPQTVAGTLIGRVFTSGEGHTAGTDPTVVMVPLVEGSCPIGVLELDFALWRGGGSDLPGPIGAAFGVGWVVKSRYTHIGGCGRPAGTPPPGGGGGG